MKKITLIIILFFVILTPKGVLADDELSHIRIKTDFNIWKVNLNRHDWTNNYFKSFWNDIEVRLPENLNPELQKGTEANLSTESIKGIDFVEMKDYLDKYVAPEINREKQDVTISLDEEGKPIFEGFAFSGQSIDYEKAFYLIRDAFLKGEEDVRLPIKVDPATVTVSPELEEKGIIELIGMGETDYSGSPYNRRSNIRVGLSRFNGWLIPPKEKVSVIKKLGAVNQYTGYLPELVIKGDKTIPEYGGGLCQVSTTVYRSILFSGLPINERRNHSYAVSYYDPQGLDATIYIPSPDLKFTNDTEDHILIQTTMIDNKAYSNIYGTAVDRHVDLIGPWYYSYRNPPPTRIETTSQLAPGEKEIVGGAHAGFQASWYRRISHGDESKEDIIEHIYSNYQARPLYMMVGEEGPAAPTTDSSDNGT
ncbi:MAG: VanW family protein [Candidatus Heimdallarchaeota archaeon]|nr:VanW family protein [Candidatus Heimdallarchaeota archaeon]